MEWSAEEEGTDCSVGDLFGGFVGAVGSGEGIGNYQAA